MPSSLVNELSKFRNDALVRKEQQIQELETKFIQAATQLDEVKIQRNNLNLANEKLEKALEEEQFTCATLRSQLTKLQEDHYRLEDDYKNSELANKDLETRLQASENRIKGIEKELAEIRAQREHEKLIVELKEEETRDGDQVFKAAVLVPVGTIVPAIKIGTAFGPIGAAIGAVVGTVADLFLLRNKTLEAVNGCLETKKKLATATGEEPTSLAALAAVKKFYLTVPELKNPFRKKDPPAPPA